MENKNNELCLGINEETLQELKDVFETVMVACESGSEGVYG